MTPERLREWIPARLHAELTSAGPVEQAILTAQPSTRDFQPWPTGILAAIEEREVAPWLGVSCFLRAGPEAAIRRRGLYDSDLDWHRDAALLADLSLRFGDRLVEPLRALPGDSLPLLARQWLGDAPCPAGPVLARLSAAECCLGEGNRADALGHLLAAWRLNADPLLADLIDVLDERLGPPMARAQAAAFWEEVLGPGAEGGGQAGGSDGISPVVDPVEMGRALRRPYQTLGEGGVLVRVARECSPDPRAGTALQRLARTRGLDSDVGWDVPRALVITGDMRYCPDEGHRGPFDFRARWSFALGPPERARLRAMARWVGADLRPADPRVAAVRLAAWSAGPEDRVEAEAVFGDVLRAHGDRRLESLSVCEGPDLDRLPSSALLALLERPIGCRAWAFRHGLVVRGSVRDAGLAVLDPAWGPIERVSIQIDWASVRGRVLPQAVEQFFARCRNLKGVFLSSGPRRADDAPLGPDLCRRILTLFPPTVTEFGNPNGDFAAVMDRGTAIVTTDCGRDIPDWFAHARAPEVAMVGPPHLLSILADAAPPTLRRLVLVEEGTPLWAPRWWSLDLSLPSRRLLATYHPPEEREFLPDVRRSFLAFLALARPESLSSVRVVIYGGDPEENARYVERVNLVCQRFRTTENSPEAWREDEPLLPQGGPPRDGDEWEDLLERLNPDVPARPTALGEDLPRALAWILPEPWCEPLLPALGILARRVAEDRAALFRYRARRSADSPDDRPAPQGEELQNRVASVRAVWESLADGEVHCGDTDPRAAALAFVRVSTVWVAAADRPYRAEAILGEVAHLLWGANDLSERWDVVEAATLMIGLAERTREGGVQPEDGRVLRLLLDRALESGGGGVDVSVSVRASRTVASSVPASEQEEDSVDDQEDGEMNGPMRGDDQDDEG